MEKTEHFAVIGVAVQDETQLLSDLYEGLSVLQHRGQESVGISFFDNSIHTFKSMGLMSEADIFRDSVKGSLRLSHERYSRARVDFHRGELLASQYRDLSHHELCEKIQKELDATTLYYNTIPDLVRSIGLKHEELCMGCLTGIYAQIDRSQKNSEW